MPDPPAAFSRVGDDQIELFALDERLDRAANNLPPRFANDIADEQTAA